MPGMLKCVSFTLGTRSQFLSADTSEGIFLFCYNHIAWSQFGYCISKEMKLQFYFET